MAIQRNDWAIRLLLRIGSFGLALACLCRVATSQGPREVPVLITRDNSGTQAEGCHALPSGVLRRCGSSRFRHGLWHPGAPFFSPDGETVYVAGRHDLLAFDTATGRIRFEYRYGGYNMTVRDEKARGVRVDFFQGPEMGNFVLLEHTTGRQLAKGKRVVPHSPFPGSHALTNKPRALVFRTSRNPRDERDEKRVSLYDAATNQIIASLGERLSAWSLTPSEDRLAFIARGMELRVFDTTDAHLLRTLPLNLRRNSREVVRPVWNPNGRFVYVWQRNGETCQLVELNVDTGVPRIVLPHQTRVEGEPVVSPDGKYLAYRRNYHYSHSQIPYWVILKLHDLSQYRIIDVRPSQANGAFSPDAESFWLLSECGLARFDLRSGEMDPLSCDPLSPLTALAFSRDGNRLFGVAGSRMMTWDVATGQECAPRKRFSEFFRNTQGLHCVDVDSEGTNTIWAGGDSHVRYVAGGKEQAKFYAANAREHREYVVSPDRRWIVHDAYYGALRYGDLRTGEVLRTLRPSSSPREDYLMTIAPDNNTLALVHGEPRIRSPQESVDIELWNLSRGEMFGKLAQIGDLAMAMQFSRDSRELWVCHQGRVSVWDVHRKTLLGSRRAKQGLGYNCTAIGHRYLRYGYRRLHLIDLHTDQICRTWKCYDWRATSVAFSADMKLLAVASPEGPVMLCDVYGTHSNGTTHNELSFDDLWRALASDDSSRAFDSLCELIRRGDESVSFLQTKLPGLPPRHVAGLIEQLDAVGSAARVRATTELRSATDAIVPALNEALKGAGSAEQSQRITQLLAYHRGFPTPIATLRELRAAEALEVIGSSAARELLVSLSRGSDEVRLVRESQAALCRLRALPK